METLLYEKKRRVSSSFSHTFLKMVLEWEELSGGDKPVFRADLRVNLPEEEDLYIVFPCYASS